MRRNAPHQHQRRYYYDPIVGSRVAMLGGSWVPKAPVGGLPGLALNFSGQTAWQSGAPVSLASTFSFTRATQAWDSQPDGSLVSVASGSPRYGGGLGFLPEGARTNLLLQSGDFNTSWTITTATVTPGATTGVDNTASASSVVLSGSGGGTAQSVTISAASTTTVSVYAKPFATNWLRVRLQAGADIKAVWFNIAAGTVGTTNPVGTEITAIVGSIQSAANGFYRCIVKVTTATVTTLSSSFIPTSADTVNGAAADSCYLDKSQAEAGATATSYITTTVATATRNGDSMIITGAPFTAGLTAAEGTMFLELENDATCPVVGQAVGICNTASPTANNRISISSINTGIAYAITDGGVSQVTPTAVLGNTRPTKTRVAMRYKLNDSNFSVKGGVVASDTTCTIPAGMDRIVIGSAAHSPGGAPIEARISRVAFWPTGLVNSDLVALSA